MLWFPPWKQPLPKLGLNSFFQGLFRIIDILVRSVIDLHDNFLTHHRPRQWKPHHKRPVQVDVLATMEEYPESDVIVTHKNKQRAAFQNVFWCLQILEIHHLRFSSQVYSHQRWHSSGNSSSIHTASNSWTVCDGWTFWPFWKQPRWGHVRAWYLRDISSLTMSLLWLGVFQIISLLTTLSAGFVGIFLTLWCI